MICPCCDSSSLSLRSDGSGLECGTCGMWIGSGSRAADHFRRLVGDQYLVLCQDWILDYLLELQKIRKKAD
jgi:hypothetical protein